MSANENGAYVAPAVKVDGTPMLRHLAEFGNGQAPGYAVSFCGRVVRRPDGYTPVDLPFCEVCSEHVNPADSEGRLHRER